MSVEPEVEFREKHNAHVLCRNIVVFLRPGPGRMRRYLVSPFDDVGKLVLQILGRRKCLLENANEIIQCARVPEEVIADHRIARLIAKISVSEVLARFCALHFLPLNLLTEILEALQYRVQEIPRFFLMSFSCEIEHRGSKLSPSWRQICHLVSQ